MIGSTPIRARLGSPPPAVLSSRHFVLRFFHENAMERTTNDDAAKNAFNMGKVYIDPPAAMPQTHADETDDGERICVPLQWGLSVIGIDESSLLRK